MIYLLLGAVGLICFGIALLVDKDPQMVTAAAILTGGAISVGDLIFATGGFWAKANGRGSVPRREKGQTRSAGAESRPSHVLEEPIPGLVVASPGRRLPGVRDLVGSPGRIDHLCAGAGACERICDRFAAQRCLLGAGTW